MPSDAMSAAMMISNTIEAHRFYDQLERRHQRDAVIDDLINRHNALAANNAALTADYNNLLEQFQKLVRELECQQRRSAELERQLAREREEARIAIRDLKVRIDIMQPIVDKYGDDWMFGR